MRPEHRAGSLMREQRPHEHHRVTYVELFFDLVFVFAITQISHFLLAHFTPLGGLQTAILMCGVWWVWVFTSWITNWFDPERTPVRLLLFAMVAVGLFLSTSIPRAFDSRGLSFALAYVALQVGRTLFYVLASLRADRGQRRNALRILFYLSTSGVFWIAGGLAEGDLRIGFWLVALAIEYSGPAMRFRSPGLGASSFEEWTVEGGHMAERCALFIIIALGESVVVTGATFAEAEWTMPTVAAFIVAVIGSIAMWWIYFHLGAEAGSEQISRSQETGRMARLAYTYIHLPIVAGIVVAAVGDELALAHASGHSGTREIVAIVGGPLIYLVGTILFKRTIRGIYQLSHLVGIGLLVLTIPLAAHLSPLEISAVTTAILIVVAAWEAISLGSGPGHSEAASA